VRNGFGYLALNTSGIFFLARRFLSTSCNSRVKTGAVSGAIVVVGVVGCWVVGVVVVEGCGLVGVCKVVVVFLVVLLSIRSIHSLVESFDITFSIFSILISDFCFFLIINCFFELFCVVFLFGLVTIV